jgi:hypothetical protein
MRSEISAIKCIQQEFEEKVTEKVDEHLKGVTSMVEQQTRNLREEFSSELGATRRDFETQLAAV